MKIKKLIEKIEGEATLDYVLNSTGGVQDVQISFAHSRGIEQILQGKDPLDALVITPRVCGICNHAHLLAAVRALEDGYKNAGIDFTLSHKAKSLRDFTLSCELLQNHFKWFYLILLPNTQKFLGLEVPSEATSRALYATTTITKVMALFTGQWPHSSYMIPGGVSCDPTHIEVMQAKALLTQLQTFYEDVCIGMKLEQYLSLHTLQGLETVGGDFGTFFKALQIGKLHTKSQTYNRFFVAGENTMSPVGTYIDAILSDIDLSFIKENTQEGSLAKAVHYEDKLFEVGPLARAMVAKEPMAKALHSAYQDSFLTRTFARVHEIALLLHQAQKLLDGLNLEEPSSVLPYNTYPKNFEGTGVVEAARGSLLHTIKVKEGRIEHYNIITPTQWNLSSGTQKERGVALNAMLGSSSTEEAELFFCSFDVCSVCTTQ